MTDQVSNVVMSVFKYLRAVKRAPKLSRQLRDEILLIYNALEDLGSTLEANNISTTYSLDKVVNGFVNTMKDMQNRLQVEEGDVLKKLKWPFTQKETEEYLSKLENYKTTFIVALDTIQTYVPSSYFPSILTIAVDS